MVRLDDIHSLTEFQRNTREHIERLKKTGRPEVLTVNGQAELVVQDARSYQRLLDRAEKAEQAARLGRSIADYRAGRFRDAEDVLGDLEARHLGRPKAQSTGRRRAG
ncbi:MAG: type II toxin-antitoxin system Phd/YefM family antitoxin [Magnetospirillum sp. WYHS-4]